MRRSQLAYQVAIFGRLALGLYAARALMLSELKSHNPLLRTLLRMGAIVGIGGNLITVGQFLNSAAAQGEFLLPLLEGSPRNSVSLDLLCRTHQGWRFCRMLILAVHLPS